MYCVLVIMQCIVKSTQYSEKSAQPTVYGVAARCQFQTYYSKWKLTRLLTRLDELSGDGLSGSTKEGGGRYGRDLNCALIEMIIT